MLGWGPDYDKPTLDCLHYEDVLSYCGCHDDFDLREDVLARSPSTGYASC